MSLAYGPELRMGHVTGRRHGPYGPWLPGPTAPPWSPRLAVSGRLGRAPGATPGSLSHQLDRAHREAAGGSAAGSLLGHLPDPAAQVALGHDAHQPPAINDRQAADPLGVHQPERVDDLLARRDSDRRR